MSESIIWLKQPQELVDLVEHCMQLPAVALDTEFMRTDTFYPKLALIQLSDGERCYLIDPLAIDDLSPLAPLLHSEQVVKVLHAPSEDLEIFTQLFAQPVQAIFDTQLAAAYCGNAVQMSLQALLKTYAGVEVSKSESRSNWLLRPLSDAQIHYACDDVKYLLPVYETLKQALEANGRLAWMACELAQLQHNMLQAEASFEGYCYKLVGGGDLSRFKQYVLQQLCIWREDLTRKLDKPRNRVVSDKALLEISQLLPKHPSQLFKLEHLAPHAGRKYAEPILAIVAQAQALDKPQLARAIDKPLSISEGKIHKQLKALVKQHAQDLGLEASLIFKKADYMALLKSRDSQGCYHWPTNISHWRSELLAEPLLNSLNR